MEISSESLASHEFLVPHSELRRRALALQERMIQHQIDLAILQSNADVLYTTGSVLDGWVLVPASGEITVLVRRAVERTQAETCWEVKRAVSNKKLVAELGYIGMDKARIALALDVVPAADYLKLSSALPDADIVDVTHHLRSVRAVKSAWELANMHRAADQVIEAMQTVVSEVKPGFSELDAARLAESNLRAAGHQGVIRMRRFGGEMWFGQVCAAANAALPAALDAPLGGSGQYPSAGKGASRRKLEVGDLLVLDLMGCYNGYLSDCTRVIAVGGVDAVAGDLLQAQQWCGDALEQISAAARPGVLPSALYQLALELAEQSGYKENFMGVAPDQARFVGHGIGMEVDEYPFLARGFDDPLMPGMVFALEPKLVFPARAAVGIEDSFIVTDSAVEPLPAVSREVFEAN